MRLDRPLRAVMHRWRAARLGWSLPRAPVVPAAPSASTPIPVPDAAGAEFDEARAWALLEAQCALGPRFPGSAGHRAMRGFLLEQLGAVADEVAVQGWEQRVLRGAGAGGRFALSNLFARIGGRDEAEGAPAEHMLSAHWDTRPVADADPDPALRALPVPGANDGASGVAVLLELARVLAARAPRRGVVLAFWDGEDFGEHYYGSRVFARSLARPDAARWGARKGVVVDMVGKPGLRCAAEDHSVRMAPGVWAELQGAAAALGAEAHFRGPRMRIADDHLFLNRGGIPTALLIDYAYPEWHTTRDTPERCSAASLGVVGRVLERWVRGTEEGG